MKPIVHTAAALIALLAGATVAQAAPDCGRLGTDGTSSSVEGSLQDTEFCEYHIEGRAGQKLTIHLSSETPIEAFIYEPISEPLQNDMAVTLPEDAIYAIRVGMTRAVARNHKGPQAFALETQLSGKPTVQPTAPAKAPAPVAVVETGGEERPEGYVGGTDVATLGLDGDWEGVIPCASCPGIEVYLNLGRDGRYTRTQVYREETDGTFQDAGDWFMQSGVIVLASDDEDEDETFLTRDEANVLSYAKQSGEIVGKDYRLKPTGR